MSKIKPPTACEVQKLIQSVAQDSEWESFRQSERVIRAVIEAFPGHDDESHIIAKVAIINQIYSTNIYAIMHVSHHIFQIPECDARLQDGDLDLVADIARVQFRTPEKTTTRTFYSFATKYCAWHNRDAYQIYDSRVDEILWHWQKNGILPKFQQSDLRDYHSFIGIVDDFRNKFDLKAFHRKEIDLYLWHLGNSLLE